MTLTKSICCLKFIQYNQARYVLSVYITSRAIVQQSSVENNVITVHFYAVYFPIDYNEVFHYLKSLMSDTDWLVVKLTNALFSLQRRGSCGNGLVQSFARQTYRSFSVQMLNLYPMSLNMHMQHSNTYLGR